MRYTKDSVEVTKLSWVAPTTREDGDTYTATDHAGYEIDVGTNAFVSIPADYSITSWNFEDMGITESGPVDIAIRTVDKQGQASKWSDTICIEALYSLPKPPAGLSVS